MNARLATGLVCLGLVAACSSTNDAGPGTSAAPVETTATSTADTNVDSTTDTTPDRATATWTVRPGVSQVAVLGAEPGTELTLVDSSATEAATATVDTQGSLLFRTVTPGDGYTIVSDTETTEPFAVTDADSPPPATFYADQPDLPAGGFGYITVRDGTTLSANVVLPGPAADGPYPTVVEYSGYQPSDPDSAAFAQLYTSMGFAYVGVNMRGSGCSGGSYRFFEQAQSIDGYDVIEAVAAQPWVLDNEVGMVGISYPGISQLFVAATQPPSLNSITPLSVLADSYRSTLYPGGILNTGFAVEWITARLTESAPFGQAWTRQRADDGDTECADNQLLRLQNPDLLAEIEANQYYTSDLGDPLSPLTFVDRIEVPVFLAGAWQDEQTGGQFPVLIDQFTSSPHVYVTLTNGLHTEALSPPIFARYAEFLQLYVAKQVPRLGTLNSVLPVLGQAVWGVSEFRPIVDRFTDETYDEALTVFESDDPIRILVDQGAAGGLAPGTPEPAATLGFDAWPIPGAEVWRLQLDGTGALVDDGAAPTGPTSSTYEPDPDLLPTTFYDEDGPGIWDALVQWDWQPIPDGSGLTFTTAPLAEDRFLAGFGSADLWIESTAEDTDLEVTVVEVRPNGTEIYVQSGWLRASERALDDTMTTELMPWPTNAEADTAPLPAGEPTLVRVPIFPFAHGFRAGSSLRITIDAPGNSRGEWVFRSPDVEDDTVTVWHSAEFPSSLALSEIPPALLGDGLPPAPPACGALRGQPCRSAN